MSSSDGRARNLDVVVLDYGFGNVRSVQRALEHVGANVEVSADRAAARGCDGLVIPGVGAFSACMAGLTKVGADDVVAERLSVQAPVLGICVGAQVMFEIGTEHGDTTRGLGHFTGTVEKVRMPRIPHMGWSTVAWDRGMPLFAGIEPEEMFYFVHSYAAHQDVDGAAVAWSGGEPPFIAAISRGVLSATQFHPEKSGDAGLALLYNWVKELP